MNFKNRRSIRLRDYDYSQVGAYFVTVCTQYRQRLFGDVVDGVMVLNAAGKMIQRIWDDIPQYYDGIYTDAFTIMPDHIHGIVVILPNGSHVGAIPPWLPTFDKPLSPVSPKPVLPVSPKPWLPTFDKTLSPVSRKRWLPTFDKPLLSVSQNMVSSKKTCYPRFRSDHAGVVKRGDDGLLNVWGDHGGIAPTGVGHAGVVKRGDDGLLNVWGDHGGIVPTGVGHAGVVKRGDDGLLNVWGDHGGIAPTGMGHAGVVKRGDDGLLNVWGDHGGIVPTGMGHAGIVKRGDDGLLNVWGDHGGIAPTGVDHAEYSLSDVVHRFKTLTTKRYVDGVYTQNWSEFPGKLWQRNYYECIIRDDVALTNIRRYIANNPKRWLRPP
jgi:REP element-mobilizing transposase RayT